jgi:hypothetical protein
MVLVRSLLEKLSRNRIVRRRLPEENGGHCLYVSPDAAMSLWRRDLRAVDPLLLRMAAELVRPGMTVLLCEVTGENALEVGALLREHGYTLLDAALPPDRRRPLAHPGGRQPSEYRP